MGYYSPKHRRVSKGLQAQPLLPLRRAGTGLTPEAQRGAVPASAASGRLGSRTRTNRLPSAVPPLTPSARGNSGSRRGGGSARPPLPFPAAASCRPPRTSLRPGPRWRPAGGPIPGAGVAPDFKMVVNGGHRRQPSGSAPAPRPGWLGDAPPPPARHSHWRRGGPGRLSLAGEVSLPVSPLRGPGNYFTLGGGREGARSGRSGSGTGGGPGPGMLRALPPPGRR